MSSAESSDLSASKLSASKSLLYFGIARAVVFLASSLLIYFYYFSAHGASSPFISIVWGLAISSLLEHIALTVFAGYRGKLHSGAQIIGVIGTLVLAILFFFALKTNLLLQMIGALGLSGGVLKNLTVPLEVAFNPFWVFVLAEPLRFWRFKALFPDEDGFPLLWLWMP